jgi:hypothetical protein
MLISLRKNGSLPPAGTDSFESRTAEESRLVLDNVETIMLHALSWFVVFSLLALWSLAAWAFHSITTWMVSNAGVVAGGSGSIEGLRVLAWLAPWTPPELALAFASMLSAITPAVESVLNQAPALAGGLSLAVWVVWGIGSVLLIALGLVLSGMITVLRRRASMRPAASGRPAAAG